MDGDLRAGVPEARRPGRFLTGRWTDLAMLNFACPAELLAPLVPRGTELDAHGDVTQVSLVGFMFRDTRVLGVPVPFHRTFEEVNLRFYVRREVGGELRRGVVFVQELVPRWAIATMARLLYQEQYRAVRMSHRVDVVDGAVPVGGAVEYSWSASGSPYRMRCVVSGPAAEIVAGSEEEFITEHYWGYAAQRDGGTVEYQVEHPRWRVHPVGERYVEGELAGLSGPAFGEVLSAAPRSAFVATGSRIVVRGGRRLR